MVGANPIQQARDGGLDIVAGGLEIGGGTIVRVCHVRVFWGVGIEAAHQADLVRVDAALNKGVAVAFVHGDEEISIHVLGPQLGRAVGTTIVAAAAQLGNGARIRSLAHMPAAEAAGVHGGDKVKHVLFHLIARDDFCHGGAADISGANKDEVEAGAGSGFGHAENPFARIVANSTVVRKIGYSSSNYSMKRA